MTETGIVTKIENSRVTVRLDKKDECSKCGMCLFPKNANSVEISATSEINVNCGDTVSIERHEDGKLLGSLLAFGIPLILIGICLFLGFFVVRNEIFIIASAVGVTILWEIFLPSIDKKLIKFKSFTAKVISVETPKEEKYGEENV